MVIYLKKQKQKKKKKIREQEINQYLKYIYNLIVIIKIDELKFKCFGWKFQDMTVELQIFLTL